MRVNNERYKVLSNNEDGSTLIDEVVGLLRGAWHTYISLLFYYITHSRIFLKGQQVGSGRFDKPVWGWGKQGQKGLGVEDREIPACSFLCIINI